MSDGISISEGGYTAVSSDTLRDAANRAVAVASVLREASASAMNSGDNLDCMTVRLTAADETRHIAATAVALAQLAEVFAAQLARAADQYEVTELLITLDMHGSTPALVQRLEELEAQRPGIVESMYVVAAGARTFWGYASMRPLQRTGMDVLIVKRTTTVTTDVGSVAPKGAADLAKTIPTGDAQVRVDRYVMADGSQRFVVSVSGTRAVSSPTEPFDMNSNVALYTDHDSTSAEAVRRALEDAGVEPGDWLLMNAHSQAAMIADRLAPDPSVDPDMVVTWGNPGEQPMPSDVVNIDIKHTNDPVGWLGGAEYPIPTGADASFEVSRDTNAWRPGSGVADAAKAHFLEAYIETGTMMDASQDPRMDALRDPLAELAEAESVTTTEYTFAEPTLQDRHEQDRRGNPGFSEGLGVTGTPSGGIVGGEETLFRFTDPVTPGSIGIAPPPEPGVPTFEFDDLEVPQPRDDNHVGPWLT